MEIAKIDKKIKYLVIAIVILSLSIIGVSVAYYLARISVNINGSAAGTELILNIEKISTSANEDLIPLDNTVEMLGKAILGYSNNGSFDSNKSCIDKNGRTVCQVYKITVSNRGTVPLDITGGVQLVGANTPNIDCAVMNTNSTITNNNTCIGANTLANDEKLSARSSKDYYIIVYINNLHQTQYDSGIFNGTVSFVSTQGKRVKARFNDTYNAAQFIIDKYNGDSTSTITAADGVQYSYATNEHLMYDRLGGATTNLEEGNLRYYGYNPNNYIDIGDRYTEDLYRWQFEGNYSLEDCTRWSDQEYCTKIVHKTNDPILYRIIGIFDNNLKIVRDESIGNYSWDTSSSDINGGYGINQWGPSEDESYQGADLMKLLNPGYEEEVGGSLWWNSEKGTCYTGHENKTNECDFTSTGLSENAKDLIVDNLWYLGGADLNTDKGAFPSSFYIFEHENNVFSNNSYSDDDSVIRTTKWTGKVGLINPSDYGYATDLSVCNEELNKFKDSASCYSNDWFMMLRANYWTMTSVLNDGHTAWNLSAEGNIGKLIVRNSSGVFPTFYLKSDVVIESGNGRKNDPYIAG